MITRFFKNAVYAAAIAALVAGGFLACQMDEISGVRAPTKRGNEEPPPPKAPPYLETLSVSNDLVLEPLFSPNVQFYTVILPNPPPLSVTLTATAAAGLTVEYKTSQTFTPNALVPAQVVVTNADGTSTNYVIVFNDDNVILSPARLSDIRLSQGEIVGFNPEIPDYLVTVPYGTPEIVVIPTGEDEGSLFTFNPGVTIYPVAGEQTSVVIGVVSPNHTMGYYTVDVVVADSEASRLANVSLSAGSLTPAFNADTDFNYEINITGTVNLLVVDAIRINNDTDTVSFFGPPPGNTVLAEDSATASFDTVDGSLNNRQFRITVHQGLGYIPTDYTFTIRTNELPPAQLNSISFAPAPVTLRQGSPDNLSGTGFASAVTTYTLVFTHDTDATMTAEGLDGASAQCGVQDASEITVDYNPLQASQLLNGANSPVRNFVTITAHKASHIDTTYTVYFKKDPLPPATLDNLEVFGGTLVQTASTTPVTATEIQQDDDFDAQHKKYYTLNVPANMQAVIVEGTPKAGTFLGVTYSPKNFANNLVFGTPQTISVQVSDGNLDYATTTYELTVHVLEAQIPRLTNLVINGGAPVDVTDANILVYDYSIPYTSYQDGGKPTVAWTPNACVTEIKYSFDYGSSWILDSDNNGFVPADDLNDDSIINYSATKPLLIKLRAADGTEAVYTIIITQEGNPNANLTDLSVYTHVTNTSPVVTLEQRPGGSGFAPAVYTYDAKAPFGTATVYVAPAADAGSTLTYSIDGAEFQDYTSGRIEVAGLTISDVRILNIRVQAQGGGAPNTYTLYLKQFALNEALLTGVQINGGTLNPNFSATGLDYTLTLPSTFTAGVIFSQLSVSAGARLESAATAPGAAPNFTPVGSDGLNLDGQTVSVSSATDDLPKTVRFRVTAQNEVNTNVYSFYITKTASNEAYITCLQASHDSQFNFTQSTNEYTIPVTNNMSIIITPQEISANATMSYTLITNNVMIDQGTITANTGIPTGEILINQTTIIIITVVSEDGTITNPYTFSITRQGNTAAQLTQVNSITPGTLSSSFSQNTNNYTVTVPLDGTGTTLSSMKVSAGASISAQVEGQAAPVAGLQVTQQGDVTGSIVVSGIDTNVSLLVTITVTSESGTATSVYTFYVTRQAPSTQTDEVTFEVSAKLIGFPNYEPMSNNLSALNNPIQPAYQYDAVQITPAFRGETFSTLWFKSDGDNFVQTEGNTPVAVTSLAVLQPRIVIFQVRSQAGTVGQTYTFTITRQPNTEAVLYLPLVSSGSIGDYYFSQGNAATINSVSESSITISFNVSDGAVLHYLNSGSGILTAPATGTAAGGGMYSTTLTVYLPNTTTVLSLMVQPQDITVLPALYTLTIIRQ